MLEPIYVSLGNAIRLGRKQKRLNQIDLARAVKLSRVSIANIENGRQRLPLHTAVLIDKLLDLDLFHIETKTSASEKVMVRSKMMRKEKQIKKLIRKKKLIEQRLAEIERISRGGE